jgi:hypothetical protein
MPPRYPPICAACPGADRGAPPQDTPVRARRVGRRAHPPGADAERPPDHRRPNGATATGLTPLAITGGVTIVDPLGMLTGL